MIRPDSVSGVLMAAWLPLRRVAFADAIADMEMLVWLKDPNQLECDSTIGVLLPIDKASEISAIQLLDQLETAPDNGSAIAGDAKLRLRCTRTRSTITKRPSS
ncbi:MAG: hypothetical protein R3C56_35905 [Pirellulaceae bacterium]